MILKLGKSKLAKCPTGSFLKRCRIRPGNCAATGNRVLHSDFRRVHVVNEYPFARPIISYSNVIVKYYGSSEQTSLDKVTFESVCAETLDSLTDYFEEIVETIPQFKNADVTYSDGVLTVHLGPAYGTYVINRQSPNLQIWLSSPISGPKRYDFIDGMWIYKHDQTTLHSLLDSEIESIAEMQVEFTKRCPYSGSKNS